MLDSKNPSRFKNCHQAILDKIQLALAMRGLLPAAEGETADIFVVYNAGIKEVVSIRGYDYNYGNPMQAHSVMNYSDTLASIEQPETLIIDVIDAKQNRLIWRGVATDTLVPDSHKAEKRVGAATRKIFAKFPPKL